ncbi:3-hydroxyisobutyrate dehydrogenase [Ectocarpus siliculosus]|uniref:3-hydroxyisobutyrate dehydrogenase n=1 Tax=Ectocarpus siliculosus TaxID=2880 RepID=D8LD25_ECTSI|nr:3-hydroxyisobutyrate dehydrogenase [Ectocarpus siliculosus]|eukprot:CBN78392.1 3-hydroxyisobutyrate dehydrogenase [Ectocarpus siliculosus]
MGSCMATSLVRAGHDVLLFDVDARKAKAVAADTGATAASSLKEVAQASLFIVTMLPNTSNVEKVYLGGTSHHRREGATTDGPSLSPEKQRVRQAGNGDTETEQGLLDWVRSGTLVVDSSTIDPLASRRVNAIAEIKGVTMVDAPVSGGVPAAANATLTFMVGGTDEGLELARPLLMAMGSKAVHCGDAGAGCIAKVCNNLSLAISMIGVAEAMSLGSKMGMDAKVLASVLNSSTARCWSSEAYNPFPGVMENVPSSRGFQGGFAASLMEKDLHLALQAASESSQSLPMGAHAHQLYSQLCNEGWVVSSNNTCWTCVKPLSTFNGRVCVVFDNH